MFFPSNEKKNYASNSFTVVGFVFSTFHNYFQFFIGLNQLATLLLTESYGCTKFLRDSFRFFQFTFQLIVIYSILCYHISISIWWNALVNNPVIWFFNFFYRFFMFFLFQKELSLKFGRSLTSCLSYSYSFLGFLLFHRYCNHCRKLCLEY